ncbi:MAG: cell division regulator GpsB [Bacillaceae bacterium]|nr:cell division regulator GpsB [Bacillaceae bacterium]
MLEKIQLTTKEILDKDFKVSIRGYNQEEVDQFLDTIIQDYEMFQQEIERLRSENEKLKKQVHQPKSKTGQSAGQVNYDILKRLSNLEKAVFGKRFAD